MTERNHRPYRLGLDLGSNSIGWFVIWLDDGGKPCGLGPGGVRIFPDGRDPQSKASNAASRRVARGMRRRRDRYLKRRERLMDQLVGFGLMPADEAKRKKLEKCDPYRFRTDALDRELPLHHVGRALVPPEPAARFRSNRKTDSGDGESGPIKEAVGKLEQAMEAERARTLASSCGDGTANAMTFACATAAPRPRWPMTSTPRVRCWRRSSRRSGRDRHTVIPR